MDFPDSTLKPKTQLQNPNSKLHSIFSKKSTKRQRKRELKRQSKLLSEVERDFQSILSFSPIIKSDPKSAPDSDSKLEVQRRCSIKCHEFLLHDAFDGEGGEGESYQFFRSLFQKDANLRGIYVHDSAKVTFLCLVCGEEKKSKMYESCIGLVQHACTVETTKKIGAHRAFGRVVCEVLGWNVNEHLNLCKPKVDDKLMELMKKKVSLVSFRSAKSCNVDESKPAEKVEEFNFDVIFPTAESNTFQSSAPFNGINSCLKTFKSTTSSSLQMISTRRISTSSHLRTLGPTIGQCIEKLKSLQGLCGGSELFNFACNLMRSNESREIFMEMIDDTARYTWLEYNYNKDGQFKS